MPPGASHLLVGSDFSDACETNPSKGKAGWRCTIRSVHIYLDIFVYSFAAVVVC